MMMDILYIIAGLVLLFFGGEGLIRGAVSIATRLGLSTLLVSVVVVGFGTSAPELLVSLQAAFNGTPDIALGNVVGSNIANVLLILGAASLLTPVICQGADVRRDALAGIGAVLILAALSFTHELHGIEGGLMTALLGGYIWYCYRAERKKSLAEMVEESEHREHMKEDLGETSSLPKSLLFTVVGLGMLLAGANFLVDGAVSIARIFGVSEAVIGLTLVAVGTSLPELATAIVAAMKKHADVVIGNVLGSNLFNILFILGLTGLVAPIPLEGRIIDIDVWVALATSVVLFGFIRFAGKITRPVGIAFLIAYAGYSAWLFVS